MCITQVCTEAVGRMLCRKCGETLNTGLNDSWQPNSTSSQGHNRFSIQISMAFFKLQKATIRFVMSVCLSSCTYLLTYLLTYSMVQSPS